nr:translation initiation factor IF-2 N-terminal domain-containing protein [Corynebacterium occultum]
MRVHALAKLLGMTSKDLILALDDIAMVKVAQSTLSLEESTKLLDALGKPAQEAPGTLDAEPVEKIRQRVEKNVANEIHQIEERVERELAEVAEHPETQETTGAVETTDTPAEEETNDFFATTPGEDELLEDIVSEITPAPQVEPAFQPPIFRAPTAAEAAAAASGGQSAEHENEDEEDASSSASRRRRRGRRGAGRGRGAEDNTAGSEDHFDTPAPEVEEDVDKQPQVDPEEPAEPLSDEPVALKGSTRLEAQRRRRTEMREEGKKKRHIVSQAEFLARRESVERTMVVRERSRRDHPGVVTQVGVLEDELLVEHFVTSEEQGSLIGNIYLGRVQNVLPSMEAAFIDIGKGRNGVLYAGEVDWKAAGLGGRSRRIEQALRSGDQVLVQVTKDPVGHKGARLSTQISLAGRFLVYVPGGRSAGISRKLPAPERKRLKEILKAVVPGEGGAIIRTAAEGVSEDAIAADVNRLHSLWEDIQERTEKERSAKGAKPISMYEEPNMLVKVIRDLFNEDFQRLVVEGDKAWNLVHAYVKSVAPDLLDRVVRYHAEEHDNQDAFIHYRIDEQLQKALSRKVWLPSGGSLVIDRTEAMTVIDVNTGKFTGTGGNLEETVTRNNLEAAEEIVRQMRLRDIGGMIVVDFIDMVLPENRDLVLRRLNEFLGRDRTRHQVSEVTSLGLVQMTRKRLGTGLLETFSTDCEHCEGRGLILHEDPVEHVEDRPLYGRSADKREEQKSEPRQGDTPEATGLAAATRRKSEPQPHTGTPARSIEDLAAAVVIVNEPEKDTDTRAAEPKQREREQEPANARRGGRSRGRRRRVEPDEVSNGSRGSETRRGAAAESDTSELESIVAAALNLAEQEDPDEPSAADYAPRLHEKAVTDSVATPEAAAEAVAAVEPAVAPGQSYEAAVAEFEASPRRRRRTRGNSRSDQRPQPEDFKASAKDSSRSRRRRGAQGSGDQGRGGQESSAPDTTAQPTVVQDAPIRATATAPEPEVQVERVGSSGGRGRRRVVRRVVKPIVEQPEVAETPQKRQRVAAQQAAVREEKGALNRSGRGRRRVVRRTSTTPDDGGAGVDPQVPEQRSGRPGEAPVQQPPAPQSKSRQGGGEARRSGRRSTRRSQRS